MKIKCPQHGKDFVDKNQYKTLITAESSRYLLFQYQQYETDFPLESSEGNVTGLNYYIVIIIIMVHIC